MRRLRLFIITLLLSSMVVNPGRAAAAPSSEGQHGNSVSLNGTWEYAVGDGSEQAETTQGAGRLRWQGVILPGVFMPWSEAVARSTRFVWARRTFSVTAEQASRLAVLRWNQIRSGAVAYVNGRKVGENAPTGPYQVLLPVSALSAGENTIVLKVAGTAGVARAKSGAVLIPAGFGPDMPEITGDVWIDFADRAYLKWALALPDLANSKVTIRVTPTGLQPLESLTVRARVRPWPDGAPVGEGQAEVRLRPDPDPLGGEHFFVEVPMASARPWTYEDRSLYVAEVWLSEGNALLDEVTFRFGMREIGVADSNYKLNGRNLWLRGSNLVFEWDWGDVVTGHEVDYLVTEAREMSMNSFRTHTRPPPKLWADICDEHGTMLLAEFPVLYNYADYKFTPEELETWHRNCLLDAAGWMSRLWNHPAVIMWVLSNESTRDNEWEEGPFQAFVNALDPTRPTLRTGTTGTRDNYDVHTCGNITDTVEGNLAPGIPEWFRSAGDRTTTNTEYMNYFGHPKTQWAGVDDERADQIAVAQIGAEHTEAMRRARVDGIWPYMYAGWTRTRLAARVRESGKGSVVWKANYAAPASACWHSTLSPVLASLDLFDADYLIGQEVRTDLYLVNDSWHDAPIRVDLLLTDEDPEFIPEAECFSRPVARWSYDFTLRADTLIATPITWRLPKREGNYWLTARTTGLPGRPVLSQRFVRAVRPPEVSAALRDRRFVVLGGSAAADAWFQSRELQVEGAWVDLVPGKHVVVIWDASRLTADEKRQAQALRDFAAAGGRVVALATRSWDWTAVCEVRVGDPRGSRVFPYEGASHRLLAGLRPECLQRWNGLPGTVAVGSLDGPALAAAEKLLWVRDRGTTVAASVPVAGGKGTILFSQLDVQRHIDRSQSNYDPVAESILINMLQ